MLAKVLVTSHGYTEYLRSAYIKLSPIENQLINSMDLVIHLDYRSTIPLCGIDAAIKHGLAAARANEKLPPRPKGGRNHKNRLTIIYAGPVPLLNCHN
jgi:hypothetical protein